MAVKVRMDGIRYVRIAGMLTVGDITALAVYQVAQPRHVTKIQLALRFLLRSRSGEQVPQPPTCTMVGRPRSPTRYCSTAVKPPIHGINLSVSTRRKKKALVAFIENQILFKPDGD